MQETQTWRVFIEIQWPWVVPSILSYEGWLGEGGGKLQHRWVSRCLLTFSAGKVTWQPTHKPYSKRMDGARERPGSIRSNCRLIVHLATVLLFHFGLLLALRMDHSPWDIISSFHGHFLPKGTFTDWMYPCMYKNNNETVSRLGSSLWPLLIILCLTWAQGGAHSAI